MTYRALTKEETLGVLLSLKAPAIFIHARPDGDCVGSAAALAHLFALLGERATVCTHHEIPDRLKFLTEGISVADAGTVPSSCQSAVAVDVASPAQLSSLDGKMKIALRIDHHEKDTPYADAYVLPRAAATGEIILSLALALEAKGKIETLPMPMLNALYAAIASDTGGFRQSNTTKETHTCAAYLHEKGVDATAICRALFECKTREDLRAEQIVLANLREEVGGRIVYTYVTNEILLKEKLPIDCFETAVDIARSLQTAEIACALKQTDTGTFRVSLRSVSADVASVAAHFGGGGHLRAAGCTLHETTVEDAWRALLPELEKALGDR